MKPLKHPVTRELVSEIASRFPHKSVVGLTPSQIAVQQGQQEVIEFLATAFAQQHNLVMERTFVYRLLTPADAGPRGPASASPGP